MTQAISKDIKIVFYHCLSTAGARDPQNRAVLTPVLASLAQHNRAGIVVGNNRATAYQLREVTQTQEGFYFGTFVKFEYTEIPVIGRPTGSERNLDLLDDEGLIEKLYFLYIPEHDVLVCRTKSTAGKLGTYLTEAFATELNNRAISFAPVLQSNILVRLLSGECVWQSVELKIARPNNDNLFPDDPWSEPILGMLSASGGAYVNVKIGAELRKTRGNEASLPSRIKSSVRRLLDSPIDVRAAKIEADGYERPIDLLKDRLQSTKAVSRVGRYFLAADMQRVLEESYHEHEEEIRRYFAIPT